MTWFRDNVGVTQALNNLQNNSDGITDLDAPQVITVMDQTYGDPVVLTKHVTLSGQNVTFDQTVDSDLNAPWNLTVNTHSSGVTWFRDNVGVAQALNNLVTNADGRTDLDAPQVITVLGQTFGDDVVLTTDVTVNGTTVSFRKTVNADLAANNRSLVVNAGGVTTFGGAVGNNQTLLSLTTDGPGTTDLNGSPINATTVDCADDVVLTTDVTVNGTTVSFRKTVNADLAANNRSLVVNAGGVTTFGGAVGNNQTLLSLTTDGPGTTDLNGSPINATTVDCADDVVLTTDVTVNGTTVSFRKTVNADLAANNRSLVVNAGGVTTFGGAVGNNQTLLSLTTDGPGTTDLNGSPINATTVDCADDVVLTTDVTVNGTTVSFRKTVNADLAANNRSLVVNAGGVTTFGGAVGNNQTLLSLTTDGPGTTDLNGSPINATTVDCADDVVLTTDVTVNGTTVSFRKTVNADLAANNRSLVVNAGGVTTFGGAVGNNQTLLSLTTDGPGTTDLNGSPINATTVDCADDVVLTTDVTVNGTTVSFRKTVNADLAANNRSLVVNAGGVTTFGGAVGNNQTLLSLTTDGPGTTDLNGSPINATTVDCADDVVLTTDVTVNGTTVSFRKTVNADLAANNRSLVVNAGGVTTFGGAVGNNQTLLSLTTDGPGTTDLNGSPINATTVDCADDVVLTTDVTVNGTTVSFRKTVNADLAANNRSLVVNAGGVTTFGGAVGNNQTLLSLTTDGPGTTDLNGSPINATTVDCADDVVLTTDVTVNGTTVSFRKTVNADLAANNRSLVVNAGGVTTFGGAVGNNQTLLSLTTDGPGTTDLNGSPINATTVDCADDVVLTTDVTVNGTTVSFRKTVNADLAANNRSLVVNAGGVTTFGGAVGNNQTLLSLTTDGPGTTDLNGSPINATTVDCADDVVLTTDVTVNGTTVSFRKTVNADLAANNRSLVVNAGGVTTFGGAVGNNQTLLSLTTDGPGTTDLNGSPINATTVDCADDVVLTTDVTVNGTTVSFRKTVNADLAANNRSLVVNAGGVTTFGGAVGNNQTLLSLTTDGPGTTDLNGSPINATTVDCADDVVLTTDVTVNGHNVTFGQRVDSDAAELRDLTINTHSSGVTWFRGDVGATRQLRNLRTNSDGSTHLGSSGNAQMLVTTQFTQFYQDPVVLESHTRIEGSSSVSGDAIVFEGTVDSALGGPFDLSVDSVRSVPADLGVTRFLSPVGAVRPVRDVTVETAGPFRVVANIITNKGPNVGDPLGDIEIAVVDRAGSGDDDFFLVQSANPADPIVRISSVHGNVTINVGDDAVLEPRTGVEALAGRIDIRVDSQQPVADSLPDGAMLDIRGASELDGDGHFNRVAAPLIHLEGGPNNDEFLLQFARFRPADVIQLDGGGNEPLLHDVRAQGVTTRGESQGGACGGAPATYEVSTISLEQGDQLTAVDSDSVVAREYLVNSSIVAQVGGPVFQYSMLEQIDLTAGAGADTLRVSAPVMGVSAPVIVTWHGSGSEDHMIINGSTGNDNIIVGPAPSGVRSVFEVEDVEFLWVRGFAGDDFISNDTNLPSLLEGDGLGVVGRFNDTLLGGSSVDLLFAGRGEDVLFGRGGNDYLYADTDFDGVSGGVLYMSEATDETVGDYLDGGAGFNSAVQVGQLDRVVAINRTLIDGGACKDVITWLKAQIILVGSGGTATAAAVNALVADGLSELGITLRDPNGPVVVVPSLAPSPTLRLDVNADGKISPIDALLVINLLNRVGSGPVAEIFERMAGGAGGEADGDMDAYFDVNRDGHLSPRDALLVINRLNRADGEGEPNASDRRNDVATMVIVPPSSGVANDRAGQRVPLGSFCSILASGTRAEATDVAGRPILALPEDKPLIDATSAVARAALNISGESVAGSEAERMDDEVLDLLVAEWLVGRSKTRP